MICQKYSFLRRLSRLLAKNKVVDHYELVIRKSLTSYGVHGLARRGQRKEVLWKYLQNLHQQWEVLKTIIQCT